MRLYPFLNRNNLDLNHPASEIAVELREDQDPLFLSLCFLFCRGILGLFLDENFSSRNQLSYLRCLAGGGGSCLPAPLPGPVPLLHHAWRHGPCVTDCAATNRDGGGERAKERKRKENKNPSKNNKPKQKFLTEKVRSSAGDALVNPPASRPGSKKHVEGRPVAPKSWFKPQQQNPVGTEESSRGRISSALSPARKSRRDGDPLCSLLSPEGTSGLFRGLALLFLREQSLQPLVLP